MNGSVSPWSPRQRRWLQALGHAVLRAGGDGEAPVAALDQEQELSARGVAPPRPPGPDMRAPVAGTGADRPARRPPQAPPVDSAGETAGAPARPVPGSMRRPSRLPDRLQLAMLRASGLDPADPAAQEAMAHWPVDRLRGDGAAKRAFWPQLRVLRRRP